MRRIGLTVAGVVAIGFVLPQALVMPVLGASATDWNSQTFWYEPWGRSGVHKGIDIFASRGTPLVAPTAGVVVYAGTRPRSGAAVLVLTSKWRLHYFAHLESTTTKRFDWLSQGEAFGTVGATGNAAGKPPHLHYSIVSLVPLPWRADFATQGWKKMFYLDPGAMLLNSAR